MQTQNKKIHGIIAGCFILLIGLPFLGSVFDWDLYPPQNENRNLAEFPNLEKTTVETLPEEMEQYYNDHFGFRNTLIRQGEPA